MTIQYMIWQRNGKHSLAESVESAVRYFEEKYKRTPLYVLAPETISKLPAKVGNIPVMASRKVLPFDLCVVEYDAEAPAKIRAVEEALSDRGAECQS